VAAGVKAGAGGDLSQRVPAGRRAMVALYDQGKHVPRPG
jgi:hypothetical protein